MQLMVNIPTIDVDKFTDHSCSNYIVLNYSEDLVGATMPSRIMCMIVGVARGYF